MSGRLTKHCNNYNNNINLRTQKGNKHATSFIKKDLVFVAEVWIVKFYIYNTYTRWPIKHIRERQWSKCMKSENGKKWIQNWLKVLFFSKMLDNSLFLTFLNLLFFHFETFQNILYIFKNKQILRKKKNRNTTQILFSMTSF